MAKFKTLKDALIDMQASLKNPANRPGVDWRATLPEGSRWMPGDPGKPSCPSCKGTGYVKLNVRVGTPNFGRLFVCDCVDPNVAARLNADIERQFYSK